MGDGISNNISISRSFTISDIAANQANKVEEIKLQNEAKVSKDDTDIKKDVNSKLLKEESSLVKPGEAFAEKHKVANSEGKAKSSHKQFMANTAKTNAVLKQKVDELKQQQKANMLKEWTLVDKPTEELSEAQRKAAEDGDWTVIDETGEEIVTDSDVRAEVEELNKQVNSDETKAADKPKADGKTKVEAQAKPEEGAKTEEKTKTKEGAKTEGKDETEKKDGADKTEKKDGAEKAEGEKKAEAAEKKDGDIKVWFDKHPRFKLAMVILEQILDAVIGVMSGIASKLPDGVGGCITGGLSIVKGLAGFHKLDSLEADLSKVINDVKEGGEQIAGGIEKLISDPNPPTTDPNKGNTTTPEPGLAAKIINSVGTMCGELSGAKSWEDVLNTVGKSAANIVAANNSKAAEITDAVKASMGNFTKAISRGVEEAKKGIKNSDSTNDEKTMNALEMFKKTLAEDATLSEGEKNLVKALSDGAIKSIKAKGSKKTLDAYEETLGATASAILKGRNKEIAEQTLALMKEVRAEEDPFKAALHVIDKAKAIAGFESKEVDALKEAVADAGKTVENAADPNASESSVQTDVGSFQDRLKNLEKLMKG